MSRKSGTTKALLRITAAFLLLTVVLLGALLGRQRWTANKAMASRELIEATLSAPDSYTPPLDAPIAPGRLEVFLAVRADLAPYCPPFTELSENFSAVGARASAMDGPEEPATPREVAEGFGDFKAVFKSMYRTMSKMNTYGVDRNEALLRHGMGLGEFTFINVAACFSSRGLTPGGFLGRKEEDRIYDQRVAGQIREMIGRHATLLEDEPTMTTSADRELPEARLTAWRREYEALEEDPARLAFADGLPVELEQVLRPFDDRLERLCCPATSELDLARVVPSHGVWYDHR